MKQLALAIILILLATSVFAGNVTTLGMFGTAAAPSYTTEFSSIWDGSDMIDTGGSGTGVPWTGETDASSVGDLASGGYEVTVAAASSTAYVAKTLGTVRHDVQLTFDFTPTVATSNWGASNNILVAVFRTASAASLNFYVQTNAGGAMTGIAATWFNTAGGGTTPTAAYTFADATKVTFTIKYKEETTDGAADGSLEILIDDVQKILSTSLENFNKEVAVLRVGLVGTDRTETGTLRFDNVDLGYK